MSLAEQFLQEGNLHYLLGEYQQALEKYREAAIVDERYRDVYSYSGLTKERMSWFIDKK